MHMEKPATDATVAFKILEIFNIQSPKNTHLANDYGREFEVNTTPNNGIIEGPELYSGQQE